MPTHFDGPPAQRAALDVFIKLIRAAASVEARTGRLLTEAGLTTSQFGALETLHHLGPMTAGKLAEKHLKSPNNFTVVLSNLEKLGLVRRERDEKDRRLVWVSLTDAGREKVESILPPYFDAITRDIGVLTAQEQRQLAELLRTVGTGRRAAGP